MKAIMLAAGCGTRGYPFTYLFPKLFQQIGGIPLVEYMLSWFGAKPVVEQLYIVVGNNTTAETLRNYICKRRSYLSKIIGLFGQLGYEIEYANPDFHIDILQAKGWGTGGDLRLAIDQINSTYGLGDDFLVCNADYAIARKLSGGKISPQLDLSEIIEYHANARKALKTVMTVALVGVERKMATQFGVAQLEDVKGFKVVSGFIEKPDIDDISEEPKVNAGIYVLHSDSVLSSIDELLPDKPDTSLEKTLLERLAMDREPRLAAYLLDLHAWFDVGTLEKLVDANIRIASMKGGRN